MAIMKARRRRRLPMGKVQNSRISHPEVVQQEIVLTWRQPKIRNNKPSVEVALDIFSDHNIVKVL